MTDTLNKWFEGYDKEHPVTSKYELFQGGVTRGAVSMRERAMRAVLDITIADQKPIDLINGIVNTIGKLPDIPNE